MKKIHHEGWLDNDTYIVSFEPHYYTDEEVKQLGAKQGDCEVLNAEIWIDLDNLYVFTNYIYDKNDNFLDCYGVTLDEDEEEEIKSYLLTKINQP